MDIIGFGDVQATDEGFAVRVVIMEGDRARVGTVVIRDRGTAEAVAALVTEGADRKVEGVRGSVDPSTP